jgi:hypothetical protein
MDCLHHGTVDGIVGHVLNEATIYLQKIGALTTFNSVVYNRFDSQWEIGRGSA